MTPTLDLILGPTGLDKTGLAHRLAAAAARPCPVVAWDRIQCYRELTIGSNRPVGEEVAGVRRLYLDTGRLADGPITAEPAVDRFIQLQGRFLEEGANALVVEGGSISLTHELLARTAWYVGWRVRVTVCVERSASRFESGIASRVERMLGYHARPGEARTLQQELVDLWDDPSARKHASDIVGYQQAINLCARHGIAPQDLAEPAGSLWRYELAEAVRDSHLDYARKQRRALAEALPALQELGRIEWSER
ncbi:isopentenyl transferase family protein [Streptomyces sp. NPDC020681]|uniref:isopentenyl transferase family protein n=1 Tax=Streptomyces sp. NPDC020681 TaxID=3365083 RepID=UPI0037A11902